MNTPEIRFKGFNDDWEQRELSEIATMHARIGWQNLRKTEFLDSGDYYLITGTDFVDGEVNLADCHYVTKDRYDQDINIQIENGSILITKDGTLGKVAYVKGLEKPATLNAGVFNVLIRDKKCVYGKYLFQYLKAPFLLDYVNRKATGGTIKHLNQEILVDFPVILPSYDEQVLLGDAFDNLDNLITLHQRKLDTLKNYKKAMLVKMFPQNGQKVPEIRFKGFSGDWEQRRLGDIVSRVTRKNEKLESDLPLTISAQYGLIDQNKFFNKRIASQNISGYYLLKKGEFAYNKSTSADAPWGAVKRLDRYEMGVLSTLYIVFAIKDSNVSSDFLSCYFDTDGWHKPVSESAAEGARNHGLLNISAEDFFNIKLLIPKNKNEQELVGLHLKKLDDIIFLYQYKLDKLKDLKQAMLNKMFVKGGN